jgi:hypothetical protein
VRHPRDLISVGGIETADDAVELDARWVGVEGAGPYLVRRWSEWHRHITDFGADYLAADRFPHRRSKTRF